MVQMKYASWTPDEPEQEESNDEPTTRKDGEESSGMYIVTSKFLNNCIMASLTTFPSPSATSVCGGIHTCSTDFFLLINRLDVVFFRQHCRLSICRLVEFVKH